MVRRLDWNPVPHVALHGVQSPKSDHLQSTEAVAVFMRQHEFSEHAWIVLLALHTIRYILQARYIYIQKFTCNILGYEVSSLFTLGVFVQSKRAN